ncbi:dnaJ homolog subfamily C member 10-like [Photinus pyralis]|nr:dnaJ homolog subfamily C member 10-like [Photinus pyralis]
MKYQILVAFILTCTCIVSFAEESSEDLYKLLEIPRDANAKDIRKAFKKLAVKLHPDKNQDDPDADAKFAKFARAYEILKDPESRKQYDLFGDVGDKSHKQKYQSYTYYRDQFGIYDDDPLIITLTRSDYELNVLDTSQNWFVNFYSAQCHHCHELAPIWRKLSIELEGVLRIAAVNCEEDWALCRQLGIMSYPTLLYYEKDATLYQGEKYQGERTVEDLQNYVLGRLNMDAQTISPSDWDHEGFRKKSWLLLLCPEDCSSCPEPETIQKLAAIFEGLISVGIIRDTKLANNIHKNYKAQPIVFWEVKEDEGSLDKSTSSAEIHSIEASDTKEIVTKVLGLLPEPQFLNEESFKDIRTQLRLGSEDSWLICFHLGAATDLNLQWKRIPTWLPNMKLGLIHCGRSAALCASLHVSHYPAWGVLKQMGAFELYTGRDILHEIVAFARESSRSTNLHALSPAEFYSIIKEGGAWFIDWYAPWCPPCKKLLPEMRKASQHFQPESVQFGTIDCTLHSSLCSYEGIRAYPTTRFYNRSKIHHFHGVPNEQGIVEFVENMLHPSVTTLDEDSFIQVQRKSEDELWIVDFYAPWCAPCQRLMPQMHALAKQLSNFEFVRIGQVDCTTEFNICNAQNIKSYPTIRLYPLGSKGLNTVAMYNGHFDVMSLKKWVLSFMPGTVVKPLGEHKFHKAVLSNHDHYKPWLVDFYAPWCGHCVHFEPEFLLIAKTLDGRVKCGKVNCQDEHKLCQEVHVHQYPTVYLYLSPNERHEITSQVAADVVREVNSILTRKFRDEL